MAVLSYYKRKCDLCGNVIDIDNTVSVIRGEVHLCHKCAGQYIAKRWKTVKKIKRKKLK